MPFSLLEPWLESSCLAFYHICRCTYYKLNYIPISIKWWICNSLQRILFCRNKWAPNHFPPFNGDMQSSATAWEAIVPAAKTSPYCDRKRDATVLTQLSHPDGRPWDSSTEQLLQQLEVCIFLTRPSITIKPEHTVFLVFEAIHSNSGMGSIVFGAGKNKYKTPKSWLQVQLIFFQGSSSWNQWVLSLLFFKKYDVGMAALRAR